MAACKTRKIGRREEGEASDLIHCESLRQRKGGEVGGEVGGEIGGEKRKTSACPEHVFPPASVPTWVDPP